MALQSQVMETPSMVDNALYGAGDGEGGEGASPGQNAPQVEAVHGREVGS